LGAGLHGSDYIAIELTDSIAIAAHDIEAMAPHSVDDLLPDLGRQYRHKNL
jgi:hypothetical protein